EMLAASDIDAMWSPPRPGLYHPERGPLLRLFPDMRDADRTYFRATGIFPPLHLVVLRRTAWEAAPWIGRALVDAFDRCNAAFAAAQRGFPTATPWEEAELDETEALMGADFHVNGLEHNRLAMQAFNDQAHGAGIIARRISVEECFSEYLAT